MAGKADSIAKRVQLACANAGVSYADIAEREKTRRKRVSSRIATGKIAGSLLRSIADLTGADPAWILADMPCDDDWDSILRCMNNVAQARNHLLNNDKDRAMEKINDALSWCFPLIGVNHPMALTADHISPPKLLGYRDMIRLGPWSKTPTDHPPKQHFP